jgi:hypothetical protein
MSKKAKILSFVSACGCVITAFAALAIVRARSMTAREACIQNLRQIDAAQAQWTVEQATNTSAASTKNTPTTQ